jgi:hypothetical protein
VRHTAICSLGPSRPISSSNRACACANTSACSAASAAASHADRDTLCLAVIRGVINVDTFGFQDVDDIDCFFLAFGRLGHIDDVGVDDDPVVTDP